jgi:predicted nucleic acid-binding protein
VYLVDTNVISAFSTIVTVKNENVRDWLETQSATLFLSAVTVAEIENGIAKAAREGSAKKAAQLSAWLESVLHLYGDRILPVTTEVARLAGRLSDAARASGLSPGFADILIAATVRNAGLTILTRNTRHFAPLGISALDPWQLLPR